MRGTYTVVGGHRDGQTYELPYSLPPTICMPKKITPDALTGYERFSVNMSDMTLRLMGGD
jgi:hypothetical protein